MVSVGVEVAVCVVVVGVGVWVFVGFGMCDVVQQRVDDIGGTFGFGARDHDTVVALNVRRTKRADVDFHEPHRLRSRRRGIRQPPRIGIVAGIEHEDFRHAATLHVDRW